MSIAWIHHDEAPLPDDKCRQCGQPIVAAPFWEQKDSGETCCCLAHAVQLDNDRAEARALGSTIPKEYAEQ